MEAERPARQTMDALKPPVCRCIDWYSEGESRVVEVGGVRVTVRYVGRKGRRGRLEIIAPAGASFAAVDGRQK
jgi:hypothetical protein